MIIDQAIREQVLDVTQSFLVQAPAGSGKTSLLVQRFLCLLANVQQAPEEILAITFTRKAAAEMRDRIVNALQLALQETVPDNAYQHKLWLLAREVLKRDQQAGWDLIDNPARLKIQTIDGLCSNITAQLPILAQFGAQPQVEAKPRLLYQKAVELLLQESYQANSWQPQLNILLIHLDNDRAKVTDLLQSMLAIRDQWLPVVINNLSQQDIRANLEAGLNMVLEDALVSVADSVPAELNFGLLEVAEPSDHQEWLNVISKLLTKENTWRKTVSEKEGFISPSSIKDKEEKAQHKARKDAMLLMLKQLSVNEVFRQQLCVITKLPPITYTTAQWQVLDALAVVLRVLVAQLTLVFKDHGQVDFCQVSLAAIHALSSQDAMTEVAHILVDEFQDTSINQFKLLEQLTVHWGPYDHKTLFLVGDPMQSIYRFRQSEVGLFLRAKQHGVQQIKLTFVQLSVNFRSTAPLVNWINQVFAHSFPTVDDIIYGAISYMPAVAVEDNIAGGIAVECNSVIGQAEVQRIVEIIQQTKQQQASKSIAILVRAKSHLSELLPALRAANIAYHGVELESLNKRPLIQDLLALTKALLHLDERIAWLAILRAPWCGLRLIDLQTIAQTENTIWYSLQDPQTLSQLSADGYLRVTRLISVMNEILSQRGRRSLANQVQAAWQALGGEQCLNEINTQHEADTYFNLLSVLAHRREIFTPTFIEQALSQEYLQPQQVADNAVQIMTMHKAKGLEFDVVILPSLGKKTRGDGHKLLLIEQRNYPDQHLLIAPIKSATDPHDPIYEYLSWAEKQRQSFEDVRVLYVAITRAKEKIYCLGDAKAITKPWPSLAKYFVSADVPESPPAENELRVITRLPSIWYSDNIYLPLEVNVNDNDKQIDPWQQDWLRLVGLVVHRVLCNIAANGLENLQRETILQQQNLWQQYLRQLGLPTAYYAKSLAIIAQALDNITSDSFGVNILSAQHPESYTEWSLTVRYGQEFKQVILDRAFVDINGLLWIVDYKVVHDAEEVPAAIDRYAAQITKYVKAVRNLRPSCKIKAGLYFPLQKRWHELQN